nr:MAG TPA: hypothetical protein [Caudoviricetes sp.]
MDNVPADLLRLDYGKKFSNPIKFKATEIKSVYGI